MNQTYIPHQRSNQSKINTSNQSKINTSIQSQINTSIQIPHIYVFSHFIIGYLGYYYPTIAILFIVYQLYQYSINRRFYLLPYCSNNNKTKVEGNSFQHTTKKLLQGVCGYMIAYFLCNQTT